LDGQSKFFQAFLLLSYLQGYVKKVGVAILDEKKEAVERFVFEVDILPKPENNPKSSEEDDYKTFETSLRAFLLKINFSESILPSIPKGI
jgi:hypothetical protein